MTEDDNTKELSDRALLILLHRAVSQMDERVQKLEAKAYSTQPLPANFDARFTVLEHSLAEFRVETRKNFKLLREDHIQERRLRVDLEERIELLESRLS
jgi:hypothetical protein